MSHAARTLYINRCKTHGVTNGNAVRTLYFDGVALKQYGIQLQPSVAAKTTPIYLDLLIFAHSCFV